MVLSAFPSCSSPWEGKNQLALGKAVNLCLSSLSAMPRCPAACFLPAAQATTGQSDITFTYNDK